MTGSLFFTATNRPTAVRVTPMRVTGGRLVKMISTRSANTASGSRFEDQTTVRIKPSIGIAWYETLYGGLTKAVFRPLRVAGARRHISG